MATITTNVFLDDGTARTAGEAWTLNGGSLTIRTDTRWHIGKPAGLTGSIGAITGSASLGGGILIDCRNVREVTFNSGTGVVPAIGTLITQGAVTGYLLGVWPDLASAPLAPAAAMPATGFLKFREVTGGVFSAGALTGISASADGPDVPSWIEFVQRQAVANTINRLNFFRVRGTWYTLPQVTSGSVGQIIQVPTNGGGAGTEVPAIWIETGVGTNIYRKFKCIQAAFFNVTNIGTDVRSLFCQTLGNGEVRIGSNGTNSIGFLPPAGCRIRIPNVLGRQTTVANDALNLVPFGTLSTRPDYTTTANGIIDFEFFMSDSYFLFASPGQVLINHCATFDSFSSSNEAQPCVINDMVVSPYNVSSAALILASNLNGGSITDSEFWRGTAASNGHSGSVTLCANYVGNNIHVGVITYARSTGRSLNMSQVSDSIFTDLYQYNAAIATATCSRVTFKDLDHNDRIVGSTNSTTGINMLVTSVTCDAVFIDGFTFGQKGVVTDFCNPYLALLNNGASSNTRIRNGGTITNKLRVANSTLAPQYIIQDSGVTNGLLAQRIYLEHTRTGDYIGQNSSKNITLENCQGTVGNSNIASSTTLLKGSRRAASPTAGAPAVVGTHFFDFYTSDTVGFLTFCGNEPTAETAPFVTTTLTTANGGFNAAGQFVMPAIGDRIIIETPYKVLGHTAFRNVAISLVGANASNMSYEYDLDTGSGFSGIYKTMITGTPQTPLITEVISPSAGFKMRLRVTTVTANLANAITYVSIGTDSTFVAQRDNLYPLDVVNISLTGLVANSRVQLFDTTNSVELFNSIVTGTTLNFQTEYVADFNLRTRVSYATAIDARLFLEETDLVTVSGITKAISQEIDSVYVANAIDGFSVTDIDIVDALLLVEIDAPTLGWPTIYAYTVAWNYSQIGIQDEGVFMEALDQANYLVNSFQIKNVSSLSVPLTLTNGWGRDAITNTTAAIIDNSGGSIFSNPDLVIPFSSGSGLSPTQDATLSKLDTLTENVGGLRYTTKALEQAPSGGGGGGGDWTSLEKEQLRFRIGIDGTASAPVSANPSLATDTDITNSQTAIIAEINANEAKIDIIDTFVDAIKVRTDLIPADPATNTQVNTRLAAASYVAPTNLSAAQVRTELAPELARIDVAVSTRNAVAPDNASVTAIKAKTDNLPSDTASTTNINNQTTTLLTAIGTGGVTPTEIYDYISDPTRVDVFKADLTLVAKTADPRFAFLDAPVSSAGGSTDLTPVLNAIALTATSVELEAAKDEILGATVAIDIPSIVAGVRLDLERLGGPLALTKIDTTQIITNISLLNDLSALDVYTEMLNAISISNLVNDTDLLNLQTILLNAIANKVLIRKDEIIGTVNSGRNIIGQVKGEQKIIGIVQDQNSIGV